MVAKVGLPPPEEMEAFVIEEAKRQIAAHDREAQNAQTLCMEASRRRTHYQIAVVELQAKLAQWTELVQYWERAFKHHLDMIHRLRNIKRQPRRDRKPAKKDRKEQ